MLSCLATQLKLDQLFAHDYDLFAALRGQVALSISDRDIAADVLWLADVDVRDIRVRVCVCFCVSENHVTCAAIPDQKTLPCSCVINDLITLASLMT